MLYVTNINIDKEKDNKKTTLGGQSPHLPPLMYCKLVSIKPEDRTNSFTRCYIYTPTQKNSHYHQQSTHSHGKSDFSQSDEDNRQILIFRLAYPLTLILYF